MEKALIRQILAEMARNPGFGPVFWDRALGSRPVWPAWPGNALETI